MPTDRRTRLRPHAVSPGCRSLRGCRVRPPPWRARYGTPGLRGVATPEIPAPGGSVTRQPRRELGSSARYGTQRFLRQFADLGHGRRCPVVARQRGRRDSAALPATNRRIAALGLNWQALAGRCLMGYDALPTQMVGCYGYCCRIPPPMVCQGGRALRIGTSSM